MRGRSNRTPTKRAAVLAAIEAGLTISEAAVKARMSRRALYDWKSDDPVFAADIDAAYDAGTDRYEQIARKRAFRDSDTLLIFLLKSSNPERFNRKMIAIGGDENAPSIAIDHLHHAGETVRLRIPDNGCDPHLLARRPRHAAVEIVDTDGTVLALNLDGRSVPAEEIDATLARLNAEAGTVPSQDAEDGDAERTAV